MYKKFLQTSVLLKNKLKASTRDQNSQSQVAQTIFPTMASAATAGIGSANAEGNGYMRNRINY
ncbi:MAG TPA: hypothetical protein VMW10_01500 [Alphaproteobacteria bacterium]|nr:hypothetical protein [Alphaproteobacteria bacterium]